MAWVALAFAVGIATWFALPTRPDWMAAIAAGLLASVAAAGLLAPHGRYPHLRRALVVVPLVAAAGCATIWARSELVGTRPFARATVAQLEGRVLALERQPALGRERVTLATREPGTARAIRVRLNLPLVGKTGDPAIGSLVRVRARLVPPAPPMLPGGYDFARSAWFSGLAATGTALSPVRTLEPARSGSVLADARDALGRHVRARLSGSVGGIAAALATGDHGGIAEADAQAMRDAGLAHLLSISGLHVSAVVAAAYVMTLRLLALVPWLALRLRLPLVAAAAAALGGLGYTLLTGAEVPTVRSCAGALLVLVGVALGREALSLRLLAIAALFVMVMWPEAVVGPSFQMSFTAVVVLVALGHSRLVRDHLSPQDDGWIHGLARKLGLLLLTGFAIELALMPIGFHHFHRAGIFGAFANLAAIPLTTLAAMPLVAAALAGDLAGIGAPFWWLAGKAIALLLAIARFVASRPGAVTLLPAGGTSGFAVTMAGVLWIALWTGRTRLLGIVPAVIGAGLLATVPAPDLLVTGDGHQLAIVEGSADALVALRLSRSDYARDNLREAAGISGEVRPLEHWPGAGCSADFCSIALERGGRPWSILVTRSKVAVPLGALARACGAADIVVADRRLPRACRPRWLKADRAFLSRSGGLAIDLRRGRMTSVAQTEGRHGWWQPEIWPERRPARYRRSAARSETDGASPTAGK